MTLEGIAILVDAAGVRGSSRIRALGYSNSKAAGSLPTE
jgi:hypothetical protein